MKVVIIGSGNVATILAKKLFHANVQIIQVFSKTINHAEELAKQVNATAINSFNNINNSADAYIIAVKDDVIGEIATKLQLHDKLIVHTAGSVSKNILKNSSANFGVLYPIQSIRKNMNLEIDIPFAIDANNNESLEVIQTIVNRISLTSLHYNDEQRFKLHIAAVFACNFVNYLYLQSEMFCQKEGLQFSVLQPLIEETANRLKEFSAKDVVTGPAVRGDFSTIQKHLEILEDYPEQKLVYKTISDLIVKQFQQVKV